MLTGVPLLLTALLAGGIRVSEGASCYGAFDAATGSCQDIIGDDVVEEDCCLNVQYAFKRDKDSPCEPCYPAEWSEWSLWGPCTVTCTEGVQQRRRACYGQPGEFASCPEEKPKLEHTLETQACSMQDCCPVDGGWSSWTPWSPCSVTCAIGTMEKRRECNNPAPVCGGSCSGAKREVTHCDTTVVCPTHGAWSNWGPWEECSGSCAPDGPGQQPPTQVRNRQCNNPAPSSNPPGNPCPGPAQERRDCSGLPFCPVDGEWGDWQKHSECSVTCGVGRETEKRLCDSPAPRHGGRFCVGSDTQRWPCNTGVPCPIDGRWTEWSAWNPCERLGTKMKCANNRRDGIQKRTRSCKRRANGGKACSGSTIETRSCYYMHYCPLPGTWTDWSEWSLCQPPCDQSTRSRFRKCQATFPDYPNTTGIEKVNTVYFWGTPLAQCDALDGQKQKVVDSQPCQNIVACED